MTTKTEDWRAAAVREKHAALQRAGDEYRHAVRLLAERLVHQSATWPQVRCPSCDLDVEARPADPSTDVQRYALDLAAAHITARHPGGTE